MKSADYKAEEKEDSAQSVISLEAAKKGLSEKALSLLEQFTKAMEIDFATPKALSILQKTVKDTSLDDGEIVTLIKVMDCVLGLRLIESAREILKNQSEVSPINMHEGDSEAPQIEALIAQRKEAKKAKDFARADAIRDELTAKGIEIIDTPSGTVWTRK